MKKLWYNGKVVSMDKEMHQYQAIGIENNKIIFLGNNEASFDLMWDETKDLDGALVLPGFIDTHMHFLSYGLLRKNVALIGVDSIETIIKHCRTRIEEEKPEFLVGVGWNQEAMTDGRFPNREDMDKISIEIPVCAVRVCGHMAVCNSVMLERINALNDVDPEVISHVNFENGLLREDAMRLYMKVIPKVGMEYIKDLVYIGQKDLNSKGITCVHSDDLKVIPGINPLDLVQIFKFMDKGEELSVRIFEQCLVDNSCFEEFKKVLTSPEDHESLFRTGPRKLLQDGSLGAKSAELIDGYIDEPNNHGIPVYTDEALYKCIKEAHKIRMNVAVHTIGDLALKKVCDAMERVLNEDPWSEHRHGVVHAQITSPVLLQRMKEFGLQAYIQPIFIDADMNIISLRVGEEHTKDCYNWKSMDDLGIHISGGSDCPVEPFDIIDNIKAAVTRKNRAGTKTYLPEQALTVEKAIRLFTSNAAWASRDEDWIGSLELGKLADIVILDKDLFKINPDDFNCVHVLETIINGKTVYHYTNDIK